MSFTKKEIKPKIIAVVDIGTYKIRVWICKIINREVELIWYWEKRQDEEYIIMQEFNNLKWISENISQAIKIAEKDIINSKWNPWITEVNDIIINIPTPNLFFEFSKINHVRVSQKNKIDDKELYEIMNIIESLALKKHLKAIKNNSWFKGSDLKLLISNISWILSDNIEVKELIWTNPNEVNISLLNVFIPESKYEMTNYIGKSIWKNIINIIPSEFAITGLFKNTKDVVIVDLWNSHTSIIIKINWDIKWAKKLSFGINDLIKKIRQNYNLTKNDIIQSIDLDRFVIEKSEFLNIFKDILTITIEEILGNEICPSEFFMIWGWANKFVKKYLETTQFTDWDLKIVWNISFITPELDFLNLKLEDNPHWIDWAKSNINIFAMIQTTLDFIKKDKNKIEKTLKKVIHDLEA